MALLRRLGFVHPRPALFVSGGARRIAPEHEALAAAWLPGVARAAATLGLALVSGGTNSGVMALLGAACAELPQPPPLIGVLPSGMLARRGAAILERHHSHFTLVEGGEWGAESGWLSRLAVALTGGQHPCLGLLINGGRVAGGTSAPRWGWGSRFGRCRAAAAWRMSWPVRARKTPMRIPNSGIGALSVSGDHLDRGRRCRVEQRILTHYRRS